MDSHELNTQFYLDKIQKIKELALKKKILIQNYIKKNEANEIEKIKKQLQEASNRKNI